MESITSDKHWIILSGSIPSKNFKCSLVNIYNSCDHEARAQTWIDLISHLAASTSPYLLMGDFNEILNANERGSNLISTNNSNAFKSFLQVLKLIEISPSQGRFTWFRGNSKSKLDRLFITSEWISAFPSLAVSILKRSLSDHSPILASVSIKNWGPKPFRFLNYWLSHHDCLKVIHESWKQLGKAPIIEKLRGVKRKLKAWNISHFGSIDENIRKCENIISDLDNNAKSRDLSEEELELRRNAQNDLWKWMKRRESYWAQHSRSRWLKEGDKNTRFFHTLATIRRRKNSIEHLETNGGIISDPLEIKKEATRFFQDIFTEEFLDRPIFSNLDFKCLSPSQAAKLTEKFSNDEIDLAVASCDSSKAPGPDGFNFGFVKKAWEIIKDDFYGIIHEFWASSTLPKGSNTAFITLIPKIQGASGLKNFRAISMVGVVYKIVAKILAQRLKQVMGFIIGPQQSSFIKGRQKQERLLKLISEIDQRQCS